jgi:hypothetical protein
MPYSPRLSPNIETLEQLRLEVERELKAIASEMSETIALELRQTGIAPLRPRAGMIASADGVGWNPGAGAGAYEFKGGVWVKL